MYFYSKMHWKIDGMSFQELWKLEGKEAEAAVESIKGGIVQHLYKPCAEQYVISVGGAPTVEDFDRYAMGILPMREHLIFEEVWPLEEGYSIDVFPYLEERAKTVEEDPRLLHFIQMAWPEYERTLDQEWPGILERTQEMEATKVLGLFRVAGQQRIIAIIDVRKGEEITAFAAGEGLRSGKMEKVWALRDYLGFAEDVWKGYSFR